MFPFPTTENLILWACSAIALFAVVFFRRSVRNRRHKRKQQSARRVLERIKTLPGFPQKINYLRKIDPFVFEELGNDSNLLIVFYVQIMPDDLVMQLHRF